jgi:hypothetical protein
VHQKTPHIILAHCLIVFTDGITHGFRGKLNSKDHKQQKGNGST